ncbi:MAG: YqaE/Pmp3 family membrane protein [Crocinitomicaceae bacterium]|nr:YqaE/Pmp3 family membrane protein [Crocinitomicaceae bacterium]
MKKILLVAASILFLVASCTVEKRVYRNGFNVQWHAMNGHSKKEKNTEITSIEELENVAKVVVSPKDNSKTASVYEIPTQEVITVAQNDEASIQSNSIGTTAPVVNVKGMADQTISVNQNIKDAKQISKQEIKALKKAVKSQKKSDDVPIGLLYVLCFFVPFIVVGIVTDWDIPSVLINLLWTLLCGITGVIHALIIVSRNT